MVLTEADPIKLFFFATVIFPFFTAKLGHFIINDFFLYVTKHLKQTAKIIK